VARLTLEGVVKRFAPPPAPAAVTGIDLAVGDGELVALLGPSGSGKTTLLRLVAGFETPDAGTIALGPDVVAGPGRSVPPERRRVGVVFQTFALWPHMTVKRNVGYPLEVRGTPRAEYERRVAALLATVGLTGLEARRPAELSGGQRQRVALARCLAMEPAVVLLDEPLASLDAHLRAALQEELVAFHRATGTTMVYVTHDQAEAMALADRIAVVEGGRLVQVAAPATLYREPATPTVAQFVGRGTVVPARVLGPVEAGRCPVALLGVQASLRAPQGQLPGPALVCLRSEDLRLADPGRARVAATVRRAVYQGGRTLIELEPVEATGEVRLTVVVPPDEAPAPGQPVHLALADGWVVPSGVPA
jgi:iron(III) transport system ATP-binding protein